MSPDPGPDLSYAQAVTSWSDHLRAGGTTPWSEWHPQPADPPDVTDLGTRPLPDAVHLELVRRINQSAATTGDLTGLADLVLASAAPGRGLLDVPLPWPTADRPFGTPALDPSRLPTQELIRLAVGVLAQLLPGVPLPAPEEPPARLPLPWRRRFRLHGSPATVAAVREVLLAQGHVESEWRPTHVVIARPVEVMMAEHWSAAVRSGGILKWATTWRRAEAAGRLPASIDVAALAAGLRDRRGEPLHVVVARDADEALALTTRVLRARPAEIRSSGDAPLSDLLRRVNRLTALTQGPGRVRDLAAALVSVLAQEPVDADTSVPVVPAAALPWARKVAAATARELREAGYAVHGDPDALAPSEHGLPGTINRERTLELALTACSRIWRLGGRA